MKLKINEKYENVDIWSFLKCQILAGILWMCIIWGTIFAIAMLSILLE